MKGISMLVVSLFMSMGMLLAQNDKISFNEITHDFGSIPEKGGSAKFEFIITNNSDEPLIINKVSASCGCTTPNWTKEPIAPGKTGTIAVSFNPVGRPGNFNKSITVGTNLSKDKILRIKGEVIREQKDPTANYPIVMGDLRAKSAELNFGNITINEKNKVVIEVYNSNNRPIEPKFTNLPAFLTAVSTPKAIAANAAGKIEFTLDGTKVGKPGSVKGSFIIDGINSQKEIEYHAAIKDDFSKLTPEQIIQAGKINLSVVQIDWKKATKQGANLVFTLKVSNSGKSNLNIKNIESDNANITFSTTKATIKPQEIKEIKVSIAEKNLPGFEPAEISLFSDDPKNSMKIISVISTR